MNAAIKDVIAEFEGARPMNEKQILQMCNVSLKFLDSGAYRAVYEIDDLPLVVKVPLAAKTRDHAREEYVRWQELVNLKKRGLKKLLPKIYYFDRKSGIIIMHKYDAISPEPTHEQWNAIQKTSNEIDRLLGMSEWDDHGGNFAYDENGNVVVIDLGYFR